MKIGELIEIKRNGQTGVGIVVRAYHDKNKNVKSAFVRLIYDDFKSSSKKAWHRYGVFKPKGLYINFQDPDTTWKVLPATSVSIKKSFITTTKGVMSLGWNSWSEPTTTRTERKSFTIVYNDGVTKLTYVYLVDKDTGGWAIGDGTTNPNIEKIAGLRALRNYINIIVGEHHE